MIIDLCCRVDEGVGTLPKPAQASLWPSDVVTLGVRFALKGIGNRAFYRWVAKDWRSLFPQLPDRTRRFRRFTTHGAWTGAFLATPPLLGVLDSDGIEGIHPLREGTPSLRSQAPVRSATRGGRTAAGSWAARWGCCSTSGC